MQTTQPLANCLPPPKISMHSNFSHYSFIKRKQGFINNLKPRTLKMLQPSFSFLLLSAFVVLYTSAGRSQALKLSLVQSTWWIITATSAVAHQDTTLNEPKKTQHCAHIQLLTKASTCCVIRRLHPLHKKIHTCTNAHLHDHSKTQTLGWWSQLHTGSGFRHIIS